MRWSYRRSKRHVHRKEGGCVPGYRTSRDPAKEELSVIVRTGGNKTHDVRCRRDAPVLVTSLREPLYNVRLVPHKSEQPHHLLATRPNAPQHIALLRLLQNQHQLVNTVDLVLDPLDERPKRVRDIINQRVRDPVGRDADVVLELLDAPPHVLRVRRRAEVEREDALAEDDDVHV